MDQLQDKVVLQKVTSALTEELKQCREEGIANLVTADRKLE